MTNIGDNHTAIGIKEFVILHIGGNIHIRAGSQAEGTENSCSSADSDLFDGFVQKRSVTDDLKIENSFYIIQKINFIDWLRQLPYYATANSGCLFARLITS